VLADPGYASHLTSDERLLLDPRCALCTSPLTRAVETAALALRGLPAYSASGRIGLLPDGREIASVWGVDSTGGAATDKAIGARAVQELRRVAPTAEGGAEVAAALEGGTLTLDSKGLCSGHWCARDKSTAHVAARQARLLEALHAQAVDGGAPAVFVGHSKLFRRLFRKATSASFCSSNPNLAKRLRHSKIGNCAVLAVDLRKDPNTSTVTIVAARPVFDPSNQTRARQRTASF